MNDVRQVNEGIVATTDELSEIIKTELTRLHEETRSSNRSTLLLLFIVTILCGIAGLVMASLVSRKIATPIKQLSTAVQTIVAGDLTEADLEVKTKDEIRDLVTSFIQ